MHYKMTLRVFDEDDEGQDSLIEEIKENGFLTPQDQWQDKIFKGKIATVEYRVKITCDEGYYGFHCSTHCEPRDDRHGHYTCDKKGNRICQDGWKGDFCKIRKFLIENVLFLVDQRKSIVRKI